MKKIYKLKIRRELENLNKRITLNQIADNCLLTGDKYSNRTKLRRWCSKGKQRYDVELIKRIADYIGTRPSKLLV
jgi:hypothetical protein